MKTKYYHIDVFANKIFEGNPAIVCILPDWLEDNVLQSITQEFNYVVTFLMRTDDQYSIRWFTIQQEIIPCGHGTLAAAYVIKNFYPNTYEKGRQLVLKAKDREINLDLEGEPSFTFDMQHLQEESIPDAIEIIVGDKPIQMFKSSDRYYAVYETEQQIIALKPHAERIKALGLKGLVVTAPGEQVDFVSRTFAPQIGIDEDYVTGSSHSGLVPYWSKVLNKQQLHARQLSSRPGDLFCKFSRDKVSISGQCQYFAAGEFEA